MQVKARYNPQTYTYELFGNVDASELFTHRSAERLQEEVMFQLASALVSEVMVRIRPAIQEVFKEKSPVE